MSTITTSTVTTPYAVIRSEARGRPWLVIDTVTNMQAAGPSADKAVMLERARVLNARELVRRAGR